MCTTECTLYQGYQSIETLKVPSPLSATISLHLSSFALQLNRLTNLYRTPSSYHHLLLVPVPSPLPVRPKQSSNPSEEVPWPDPPTAPPPVLLCPSWTSSHAVHAQSTSEQKESLGVLTFSVPTHPTSYKPTTTRLDHFTQLSTSDTRVFLLFRGFSVRPTLILQVVIHIKIPSSATLPTSNITIT